MTLNDFEGDMNVIYPIHLPLSLEEITVPQPQLNYTFQTHHEIIREFLRDGDKTFQKLK